MAEPLDVAIVGAGQAGLAAGYLLRTSKLEYKLFDQAPRAGHTWRNRWDSLTLFTVARYSGLPGMDFPGDPEHFPGKDEVADYLERYVDHFRLPVQFATHVRSLAQDDDRFKISTDAGEYTAKQVVIATGAFQEPQVPSFSGHLDSDVLQLHAADYRRPEQLGDTAQVLVVGAGNTGVEIAEELSATRWVHLAVGTKLGRLPRRVLGKSVHWWGERFRAIQAPTEGWYGRRIRASEGLIGTSLRQLRRHHDVNLVGRAVDAEGRTVRFEKGEPLDVDAVVWATGYKNNFDWVGPPVVDDEGMPTHEGGVTPAPGLYFLGLRFQRSAGSALIGWVEHDARHIVDRIIERAGPSPNAP